MSDELTLESLDLKKPLDKMTQKELRELCMAKIPQITGASGMSKEELLPAIKEVLGIEDEEGRNPNGPRLGRLWYGWPTRIVGSLHREC